MDPHAISSFPSRPGLQLDLPPRCFQCFRCPLVIVTQSAGLGGRTRGAAGASAASSVSASYSAAGWKTPMAPWVSMIPMLSRVSMMLEGCRTRLPVATLIFPCAGLLKTRRKGTGWKTTMVSLVEMIFDFRFSSWWYRKGLRRVFVALDSDISQPLRALCFSLLRYRRNRLPAGLGGRTPAAVPAAASCSRAVFMYKREPELRLVPLLSALPIPVPSLVGSWS